GNPWDVAFVFAATLALDFDLPVDARRAVAQVAAQEAAHTYGLVHTDNHQDVMYPYVEFPLPAQHFAQGNVIGKTCRPGADAGGWQDSAGQLMNVLGPAR